MLRPLAAVLSAVALTACGSSTPIPEALPSASGTAARAPLTSTPTPALKAKVPPKPKVGPVSIVFGGDVDLDRDVREVIAAQGVDAPWRYLAPVLKAADLAFLNLECAISTRGTPEQKTYTFRGDPSALAGAKRAGVDVFSLANNHTLDYGLDAFHDTLRHVRAAGIKTAGAGRDLAEAMRPAVFTVNGRRVAFLGLSAIIPAPRWKATADRPGIAYDDDALVTAMVRNARKQADIVIPYFHWGIEYTYSPSAAQRRAARAAIRAGATMVIGGHTHVLQPVEVVEGRLVAWSMSNLVFQSRPASVRTQTLTVTIDPDGSVSWETTPFLITKGVPGPDGSRRPQRGRVPAPK